MRNYILGIQIDDLSKEEILQKMEGFLNDGRQHCMVLPYAEFLVKAKEDPEFKEILNQADLCLAEGFGVILGSRILNRGIKNRIAGVDLVKAVVEKFWRDRRIFFFGARECVAREAANHLECHLRESGDPDLEFRSLDSRFPSFAQGFGRARRGNDKFFAIRTLNGFAKNEEAIKKINSSGAEILFVGLGMPKQEKWIARNLPQMPQVKLAIGVGGAFDFISGRVKRAPKWMQKIGFEWLWRLIIQPWRIIRIYRSVAVFSWLIISEKISQRLKN